MKSLPPQYHFQIPDTVYEAKRTAACPTGMRGRMAVFEVLEMTPQLEQIVLKNPVESKLWQAARAQGMLTMREDAIRKVIEKKIPYSEVSSLSTLMLDDAPAEEAPAETPAAS
jgi:type II secretory ATPase GspE/PulE/Tfp pilus assembly ATPase PilB-like protein